MDSIQLKFNIVLNHNYDVFTSTSCHAIEDLLSMILKITFKVYLNRSGSPDDLFPNLSQYNGCSHMGEVELLRSLSKFKGSDILFVIVLLPFVNLNSRHL